MGMAIERVFNFYFYYFYYLKIAENMCPTDLVLVEWADSKSVAVLSPILKGTGREQETSHRSTPGRYNGIERRRYFVLLPSRECNAQCGRWPGSAGWASVRAACGQFWRADTNNYTAEYGTDAHGGRCGSRDAHYLLLLLLLRLLLLLLLLL